MSTSRLERAANLAFVLGVVGLLALIAWNRRPPASVGPVLGEVLAPVPSQAWDSHHASLVLVLRSGCEYCEASVPLYHRLATVLPKDASVVRALAIFPEPDESALAFVEKHRLPIEVQSGMDLNALTRDWKVTGFPTLLLVSRTGTLLHVWSGQQSARGETHLLESISMLSSGER